MCVFVSVCFFLYVKERRKRRQGFIEMSKLYILIAVCTASALLTYSYHQSQNRKQNQCLEFLNATYGSEYGPSISTARVDFLERLDTIRDAYRISDAYKTYCITRFVPAITSENIAYLKENPEMAESFNNTFGRGKAAEYLNKE